MLPCDCELYAGDCRTNMLPPILSAVVLSKLVINCSLSDCSVMLASVACALPVSMRNACMQLTKCSKC